MTGDEARAAILAHLDRIDRAERIFVYDKEGYATPLRDPRYATPLSLVNENVLPYCYVKMSSCAW